ncbi:hypothetical protein ACLOJK_023175 [Asimina triloba]
MVGSWSAMELLAGSGSGHGRRWVGRWLLAEMGFSAVGAAGGHRDGAGWIACCRITIGIGHALPWRLMLAIVDLLQKMGRWVAEIAWGCHADGSGCEQSWMLLSGGGGVIWVLELG